MACNPFDPNFDELPQAIPIFPLSGVVLLPGQQLPLNIFEPRYLNMVFDSLGSHRSIGMIQPKESRLASSTEGEAGGSATSKVWSGGLEEAPAIYEVGCAGRITAFNETEDGRLLINLTGVCRFRILRELALERDYRRVVPDWRPFSDDLDRGDDQGRAAPILDLDALQRTLLNYFSVKHITVDWEALRALPPGHMVDFLASNLPFANQEKQALLEVVTQAQRAEMIQTLASMSASEGPTSGERH